MQVAIFVLDQEILKHAFFLFLNFRKYVNNTLVCLNGFFVVLIENEVDL